MNATPSGASHTLQTKLKLWCLRNTVPVTSKSLYGLPNGDTTTDRQEARDAWEIYNLMRGQVVRQNNSRRL